MAGRPADEEGRQRRDHMIGGDPGPHNHKLAAAVGACPSGASGAGGIFGNAETAPGLARPGHRPRRVASTRAAHGESGSPGASHRWARAWSTPAGGCTRGGTRPSRRRRRTRPSHDWAARDQQLACQPHTSCPFFLLCPCAISS
jgi:hypothetical protein